MPKLAFLLDSNVLIALDPAIGSGGDVATDASTEFYELARRGGHEVLRHPASEYDFARDADADRAVLRSKVLKKYTELEQPPSVSPQMSEIVGTPAYGTNDWVDDQLLAAAYKDAIDHVVTDDGGMHKKAHRLGISDRILTVGDAIQLLQNLFERVPSPPPVVRHLPAHALNDEDPIFDSIASDYPGFKTDWFPSIRRQRRDSLVIDADGEHAGVSILKDEEDRPFGLDGRVLKISTLKVADHRRGRGYGELLLKAIFDRCAKMRIDRCYVTVFPRHQEMITLLGDFGFVLHDDVTDLGEHVYVKEFERTAPAATDLGPLAFHVRFGPPALKVEDSEFFVVPIQPRYHVLLFPDAPGQQLLTPDQPFGNAIRKAYICRSNILELPAGAVLLFYESGVGRVQCLGVVEDTRRSTDPQEIARFVGNRTVYAYEEIQHMCRARGAIAIRFRQDRVIPPLLRQELEQARVFIRPTQSIARVREEGIAWIKQRISKP